MTLPALALTFVVAAAPGTPFTAGGLSFTAPAEWKQDAPRQMRVATLLLPANKADKEGAELGVFYFGEGQGGAVDANISRWVGQFTRADGTAATADAKTKKEKVGSWPVTVVDLKGTFVAGSMMGPPAPPKPGYRLLGAIVEGPSGAVFLKLVGPEKTVAQHEKAFRAVLAGVKGK